MHNEGAVCKCVMVRSTCSPSKPSGHHGSSPGDHDDFITTDRTSLVYEVKLGVSLTKQLMCARLRSVMKLQSTRAHGQNGVSRKKSKNSSRAGSSPDIPRETGSKRESAKSEIVFHIYDDAE